MSEISSQLAADLADRYTIERELGAGGMATVYLAEDRRHNRRVALKVLRMEVAQTLGADRFLREIEIAAKLRHLHILPLYDSGTAGNAFYDVMPLAEGEALRDRLTREKQLQVDGRRPAPPGWRFSTCSRIRIRFQVDGGRSQRDIGTSRGGGAVVAPPR